MAATQKFREGKKHWKLNCKTLIKISFWTLSAHIFLPSLISRRRPILGTISYNSKNFFFSLLVFSCHPLFRPRCCCCAIAISPHHYLKPGQFSFTYNRGHGECKYPVSKIKSCTEDTRMILNFQACPDVEGTESTGECWRRRRRELSTGSCLSFHFVYLYLLRCCVLPQED